MESLRLALALLVAAAVVVLPMVVDPNDYKPQIVATAKEKLGRDLATLPLERSWGFEEWGITAEEFERLHQFAVTEVRMLADLPVIAGAADALWRLSDAGVWIRPFGKLVYLMPPYIIDDVELRTLCESVVDVLSARR